MVSRDSVNQCHGYSQSAQESSSTDMSSSRPCQESGSSVPMATNPESSHHPIQESSSDATIIERTQIAFGTCTTRSALYQSMTVFNNEVEVMKYDENMHYGIGQQAGYAILLGNDRENPPDPKSMLPV